MNFNFLQYNKWINIKNLPYIIFLSTWFSLNILQAYFSQLHFDEAYYWIYSRHLSWGYFDHPPMVALLIKIGYSIFQNELGVRLFFVIMGTGTLAMICYLVKERENILLFFIVLLSIPLVHFHIGGFVALPDVPLLFFTTLFLVVYQKFLEKNNYKLAFSLAAIAACMIYSKYHAILIILFTVLSNLQLLKNKKIWSGVVLFLLLMMPYSYWQVINHFPSLTYQIQGRFNGIDFREPYYFIISQVGLPGIFTGIILIYLVFIYKPVNIFEKTLKWNVLGFYIFFFSASIVMGDQGHWTAAMFPALIVLSYKSLRERKKLIQWFKPLAIIGIILLLFVRLLIGSDFLTDKVNQLLSHKFTIYTRFNNWKKFSNAVDNVSKGRDVIFLSDYRRAAEYSFYKMKISPSVGRLNYRFTQFDLENYDDQMQGKNVLLVFSYPRLDSSFDCYDMEILSYKGIKNYFPYHNFEIQYFSKNANIIKPGDTIDFLINLKNTSSKGICINEQALLNPQFGYIISNNELSEESFGPVFNYLPFDTLKNGISYKIKLKVVAPKVTGNYQLFFAIKYDDGLRGKTGRIIEIKIK